MSLFSIVQGRTASQVQLPDASPAGAPSGAMPDPSQVVPAPGFPMPSAPMDGYGVQTGVAAPPESAPVTGYMHGGMPHIGFEEDYAPAYLQPSNNYGDHWAMGGPPDESTARYVDDGAYNIPGFDGGTAPKGWGVSTDSGGGTGGLPTTDAGDGSGAYVPHNSMGDLLAARKAYGVDPESGTGLSLQQADAYVDSMRADQERQRAEALGLAGAGRGPDHFFEQLAYNTQKDEADRRDAQQLADAQMRTQQQQAMLDWHKTQLQANQARQNNITSAGAQAQNAFLQGLSQADPNQAPIYFSPGLIYEDAKQGSANPDAAAANTNAPNIPGYVFDPNRTY